MRPVWILNYTLIVSLLALIVASGRAGLDPAAGIANSKGGAAAIPSALAGLDDDTDSDDVSGDGEQGDDDSKEKAESESDLVLDLEKLFPERSVFGPGASQMSFSHDGRYGAYLYRPYKERRHGNDLWLYDTQTGEVTRLTSASVMARFQESARNVTKDRIEKARKAGVIKKEEDKVDDAEGENEGEQAEDGQRETNERQRGQGQHGRAPDIAGAEAAPVRGMDGPAHTSDDGVTGVWKCVVSAADFGSIEVVLTLAMDSNGNVTGSAASAMGGGSVSRGLYTASSGRLTLTVNTQFGENVTIDATIADNELTGEVSLDIFTARIHGQRTVESNDDEQHDEQDEEQNEEDQQDEQKQDEKIDERKWGDWVSDKDADDNRAPRYAGVSTYTWSPTSNELLFVSQGDIYRYVADNGEVTRLTKTNTGVRDVQYWPDGSGYTYMQGSSLLRVEFGSHLIKQLDPDLPRGESMSGYRVSPDGQRMVFLTSRTTSSGSDRTVTIVDYRQRFARAREVRRTVSDDPQTEREVSIYLYEMGDPFHERSRLARVFTYKLDRPRDVIRVPHWSPDSTRIAFSKFEQSNDQVSIYEASLSFPERDSDSDNGDGARTDEQDEELNIEIEDAREVYRFLHYGGPNTPRMIQPMYLADNRHIVFITEQSGFRHLHKLDPVYQTLDQLTRGRFEVYPIEMCKDHRWVFAAATAEHLTREDVYRICTETGDMQRLSSLDGRHLNVAVCPNGEHVLSNFVTYGRLRELVAFNGDGAVRLAQAGGANGNGNGEEAIVGLEPIFLTDSHPEEARKVTRPVPEFFTYKNRHGHTIHGKMFKPDDWTPDDRRPLLVYVYGGPLSSNNKQVIDGSYGAPNYFFAYYMAKKHGYVTVTIDPRGTSGYGGLFEKANFEQVGRPQVEDLEDGVKWLIEHHSVDENRIGIHGWSFGGFQTMMCMFLAPDTFHVGIAGAGPTEWHNYNSWYSTGTIGPSRQGRTDLEEYSVLPLAKNLKGRLLLVHGVEDSNVLFQDTIKIYGALLEAGKETLVDLFIDPTGGHGLGGHVKTLNRYRKYEDFLLLHLGTGEAATPDE